MSAQLQIRVVPDKIIDRDTLSAPSPDLRRSMGGNNAFYHHCEIYGGRNNFAVCLHTIECVQQERMTLRSACVPAINAGTCPALKMRAEEVAKGHSIYFYDRAEQLAANEARMAALEGQFGYGRKAGSAAPVEFVPTDPDTIRDEPTKASKRAAPAAPPPTPKSGFNPDVASRNLLEEGINRTMKDSQ